ncbi:MAG: hypothetical protein F4092_00650, partial [Rhodospirillaceae bacterium]|nr:hypothetical protein [Rhodospirillaceae bacterium]
MTWPYSPCPPPHAALPLRKLARYIFGDSRLPHRGPRPMTDAYIFDAVRTPRGRGTADGALHEIT